MSSTLGSFRLLATALFAGTLLAWPVAFSAPHLPAQSKTGSETPSNSESKGSILIHLEQKKGDRILPMLTEHVFETGDVLRFRLTSEYDGFLYVVDLGSSGTYTILFPAAGTSSDNLVHRGKDSLVPAVEDGWFQLDGPAGFDVLYFLVSAKPIDVTKDNRPKPGITVPSTAPAPIPSSLKPRCNDAIFRARGECIDESAGLAPFARDMTLPPQINLTEQEVSRDIVFDAGEDDKSIKATASLTTPVVYIFRLAHH
jgi:hypothetical protein